MKKQSLKIQFTLDRKGSYFYSDKCKFLVLKNKIPAANGYDYYMELDTGFHKTNIRLTYEDIQNLLQMLQHHERQDYED